MRAAFIAPSPEELIAELTRITRNVVLLRSLHLLWKASYDPDALLLAQLNDGARDASPVSALHSPLVAFAPESKASSTRRQHVSHQVWWLLPSRWRDDGVSDNGSVSSTLVDGDAMLTCASAIKEMHRESVTDGEYLPRWNAPVPRPSFAVQSRIQVLSLFMGDRFTIGWTRRILGYGEICDRKVRHVGVDRQPSPASTLLDQHDVGLWSGLAAYEWWEDDELGLVLRFSGIANGVSVAAFECTSLMLNDTLPEAIFAAPSRD